MNGSNLNQQLRVAYASFLETTYRQHWPNEVSAPLLMQVFDEYERMSKKVLFVGQETHSWEHMNVHPSLDALLAKYADFKLGKSADYGVDNPRRYRYLRSPFWNFCRSFFHELNKSRDGILKQTNGFLWTNISKFDYNYTTPSQELQQQNKAGFELLKQEIAIVKPDVVVFLTGTKYDYWLDQLFSPQKTAVLEDDLLQVLYDPNQLLPPMTFQTQHPRTLCMRRMYRTVLDRMTELVIIQALLCGIL